MTMTERERELEERLIAVYQLLRVYQSDAMGQMTHRARNYRISGILAMMQTWRAWDEANRPVITPPDNNDFSF